MNVENLRITKGIKLFFVRQGANIENILKIYPMAVRECTITAEYFIAVERRGGTNDQQHLAFFPPPREIATENSLSVNSTAALNMLYDFDEEYLYNTEFGNFTIESRADVAPEYNWKLLFHLKRTFNLTSQPYCSVFNF